MSANILWQPVKPNSGESIDTDTPSYTIECLERAFNGRLPMTISDDDIGVLSGLAAAKVQGIDDLIEAVEKHKIIRVWSEF